jgi:hypothetical protein
MSYMENNTALAENRTFTLPVMTENDFAGNDLAEDMDGLRLSFQKVKIPSGGALQFELPGDDPENPDYSKYLEGVILFNHASGAYWPEGSEYDENSTPLCSSVDGKIGYGAPGGACAVCELNRFGTDGKGKACKNMRVLYLLRDGEYMPIQLTLPPTSIRPFSDFMNVAFVSRRRPTWGSVVQIGLKRMNNGKDDYSVATFKKLYDFSGEQLMQAKAYADGFREQAKEMLKRRAEDAGNRDGADDMYESKPDYKTSGDDEHFVITGGDVIDGERDELPA